MVSAGEYKLKCSLLSGNQSFAMSFYAFQNYDHDSKDHPDTPPIAVINTSTLSSWFAIIHFPNSDNY